MPLPIREYRFSPERQWRADYCWPSYCLILEVEGGVWGQGRHTRGSGFMKDMDKYNEMAVLGFKLIRTTPSLISKRATIELIKRAMQHV